MVMTAARKGNTDQVINWMEGSMDLLTEDVRDTMNQVAFSGGEVVGFCTFRTSDEGGGPGAVTAAFFGDMTKLQAEIAGGGAGNPTADLIDVDTGAVLGGGVTNMLFNAGDIAACQVELTLGAGIAVGAANQASALMIGSLQGVFFTDATTNKPTFANNLAASNSATDIKGFVTDDPFQLYEVQSDNTGASAQGDIGNNADIVVAAGSSPHYVSKTELGDSTLATTAANLRVVNLSDDPDNSDLTAANVNWKVIIIEHFYTTTTGV